MKNLREFSIPYVGLKLGVHKFEFDIDKNFFSHFEDSPISDCKAKVKLDFEKEETFFTLKFFIDGIVNVPCDRCLEAFDKEIFGDFQCLVKFSDELAEGENDNDELIYIKREDSHIDVAQLIYEYLILCLPIQNFGCKDPGKDPRCNQTVLAHLANVGETKESEEPDPRWLELTKLKFNKN